MKKRTWVFAIAVAGCLALPAHLPAQGVGGTAGERTGQAGSAGSGTDSNTGEVTTTTDAHAFAAGRTTNNARKQTKRATGNQKAKAGADVRTDGRTDKPAAGNSARTSESVSAKGNPKVERGNTGAANTNGQVRRDAKSNAPAAKRAKTRDENGVSATTASDEENTDRRSQRRRSKSSGDGR